MTRSIILLFILSFSVFGQDSSEPIVMDSPGTPQFLVERGNLIDKVKESISCNTGITGNKDHRTILKISIDKLKSLKTNYVGRSGVGDLMFVYGNSEGATVELHICNRLNSEAKEPVNRGIRLSPSQLCGFDQVSDALISVQFGKFFQDIRFLPIYAPSRGIFSKLCQETSDIRMDNSNKNNNKGNSSDEKSEGEAAGMGEEF